MSNFDVKIFRKQHETELQKEAFGKLMNKNSENNSNSPKKLKNSKTEKKIRNKNKSKSMTRNQIDHYRHVQLMRQS